MSHTEENQVVYLEERLEDVKKQYDQIKIIAIALGIFAIVLLLWSLYAFFFTKNDQIPTAEELQEHPYVIELKTNIDNLNDQLANLHDIDQTEEEITPDGSINDQIIYAIQIGAFEQKDLALYSESFTNFKEIRQGRFNKYSIGNFEHLDEAQEVLKEIKLLGFHDAFIASYSDGKRIKIEDAY